MTDKNQILEAYYRDNYKRLIKNARRRVGNYSLASAEDAVQEAFLRACKYYRTYNSGESFDGWFAGILTNCINQIKRDERDMGVVNRDEEVVSEDTNPVGIVYTKEVERLFAMVKPRDQEILNSYFFHGMKTREISELMNISHDVCRDVIRRFRIKVKQ